MKYLRFVLVAWVVVMATLFIVGVGNERDDLEEEYNTLRSGYTELQQEYSKALERIEYLEYKLEEE